MTPTGMQVLLATEPMDMRRSFRGLAAAVVERFGRDPNVERMMFVFANSRGDMAKVLWRDASGWCLLAKKLDEKRIELPRDIAPGATSVMIDARSLANLLDGVVRRRSESSRDVARAARAAVEMMAVTSENPRRERERMRS
jgi:transposase